MSKYIVRLYFCTYCKKTHRVTLPNNLGEGRSRFPFPHVFLHSSEGELKDLLTTIYLDIQLQIRGVEVVRIEDGDIFSEELTRKITDKLMDEIAKLEEENLQLHDLLSNIDIEELKGQVPKSTGKKLRIYLLSIIGNSEERKDILVDRTEKIGNIKKSASDLFELNLADFHLSYDGILLKEPDMINDFDIDNGDEIVLIPARKQ